MIALRHLLHHSHATEYACGVNAVGRRATSQMRLAKTTCPKCLAWVRDNPDWSPTPTSTDKQVLGVLAYAARQAKQPDSPDDEVRALTEALNYALSMLGMEGLDS